MKKIIAILSVLTFFMIAWFFILAKNGNKIIINPVQDERKAEKPLLAYTFENLKKTKFPSSVIHLDRLYSETTNTTAQVFLFDVPQKPGSTIMDKVSGVLNIPKKPGAYPVVILLRGFVPDELYQPGVGTQHVGEALAAHGFITLAPDFLGFGESAKPSTDSFEARFQTYTTVLSLLSSLSKLNEGLDASYSGTIQADVKKVGIWGHSNGGHIALSMLEITSLPYPTVLWAPVSKSFPYSILYYSDDAPDHGKALRTVLANFERDYDADLFSPINFYSWIKAPVSIHQGTNDREVPQQWSQDLYAHLDENNVDVSYQAYPGDHNMLPSAWNDSVKDTIAFYNKHFE